MRDYRLLDLSLPIINGGGFAAPAKIRYTDHQTRAQYLVETLGITLDDIGNRGNAFEEFTYLNTHCGTHFDAPWHYTPTVGGKRAMTIDEIPLDWCLGDGVKLDLLGKRPGEDISAEDLQRAVSAIKYRLKPFDIVLIQTGASQYYGQPECEQQNPGVTREGTFWLADQGVKVVGIDSFCWDRPPKMMLAEIKAGITGKYMQGHRAAGERGMCILEWLTNFDLLPPLGFQISAFPVKIEKASGSWVRVVAHIKDEKKG